MPGEKLAEYRRKRDFGKTAEPAGIPGASPPRKPAPLSRFVVQKHAASRLHYDFRLELGGVLVSWAVPKGPSLDPKDRRLAVHVEDHPVEYFDFEGTIPKGEYGGGTVMVWDWGGARWLGDDPEAMMRKGDLKFELYGRKLKGAFAIVRGRDDETWFLIKKRDEAARPGEDVTEQDRSALSGRTMEEIAAAGERVWHSDRDGGGVQGGGGFVDLARARPASLPASMAPMLATPEKSAFDSDDWLFELKLDGFRVLAQVRHGKVKLWSRRGLDATRQFPELGSLGTLVRAGEAVLDGEVVGLDEAGLPSFARLQERTGWKGGVTREAPHPSIPIVYYVFDVLHWEGYSLLDVPLRERRKLLGACLLDGPSVRLLDFFPGDVGKALFEAVKAQGQEGVVAKRLASRYEPGHRSRSWLKVKTIKEQACAVVGWTPPQGGRKYFGSLALAVIDGDRLAYCGQVGSGLNEALLRGIFAELDKHRLDAPPDDLGRVAAAPRDVTWVEPGLVCEVKYTEWTRDHLLRQATFLRMRPDLTPADCGRFGT